MFSCRRLPSVCEGADASRKRPQQALQIHQWPSGMSPPAADNRHTATPPEQSSCTPRAAREIRSRPRLGFRLAVSASSNRSDCALSGRPEPRYILESQAFFKKLASGVEALLQSPELVHNKVSHFSPARCHLQPRFRCSIFSTVVTPS